MSLAAMRAGAPRARQVDARASGAVAQALADAFADDPVARWMLPGDATRRERLHAIYTRITLPRVVLPRGAAYAIGDVSGAALWCAPGGWRPGPLGVLRIMPAAMRIWRGDLARVTRGFEAIEQRHPRRPPHWYLAVLGVLPSMQGRGLGSELMRPILERCDTEGTPAYLEASTLRSRALYERNGFELRGEMQIPGGPPLWLMWREPRGAPTVGRISGT